MRDVLVGIFAMLAGGLFCFAGFRAMRVVFPIMGLFVGFATGAGIVSAITNGGFLATVSGWLLGFILALLFAALSYLYYEFAVLLAFGGLGFALTAGGLVALGLSWNWLAVLIGTIVGFFVAFVSFALDLPLWLLVVATSIFGSFLLVQGFLIIFGVIGLNDYRNQKTVELIRSHWGWFVVWLTLLGAGIYQQWKEVTVEKAVIRDIWEKSTYKF